MARRGISADSSARLEAEKGARPEKTPLALTCVVKFTFDLHSQGQADPICLELMSLRVRVPMIDWPMMIDRPCYSSR